MDVEVGGINPVYAGAGYWFLKIQYKYKKDQKSENILSTFPAKTIVKIFFPFSNSDSVENFPFQKNTNEKFFTFTFPHF
jgi:hypothetical protein